MASSRFKETTARKSSPGSSLKDERPKLPADKAIPGPGRLETLRRLYPMPFPKLPAFLADIAARYGPIVRFSLPGRTFVMLNDPEQIKDVLVTQQHAFHKSAGGRALRWLLGDGLLTSEDPLHRQMRRIVQPAFHRERIAHYLATMERLAQEWLDDRRDGESIDMSAEMSELTLRIASETLFGVDAASQAAIVREALQDTMETYPLAIGPLGAIRRRLPFLPSTRRFARARAKLDAILYSLIAERRRDGGARGDALSLLLAAEDPETGYRLSDEQVRDEAMTLFLAGHETTANALLWTWYLLARHPEVEARLHAEIDAGGDREYTRRVLREAMRLYPPAWIIGREAIRDVVLEGGYAIPRGTTVFVCQLVVHRRQELYERPLAFDPDRWNDEVPPFAYVPFGGGARRCIGEEFAWSEGTLLLAAIARRFRFSLEFDGEPRIDALVTLRPRGEVRMRVHAR